MKPNVDLEITASADDSYDEMPYPGGAFPQTHPSHIAMVASLLGLNPASPKSCRVLELGCSMGFNLIPMAMEMPTSEFIGIDLSRFQIETGQSIVREFDLQNIQLFHKSIMDIDIEFGKFDYIICHGVYSWVPPEVQRKILAIGANNLNDDGVMYVSYNTLPGWHMRGSVRDMMKYHVQNFDTPETKVKQARALLDYLMLNNSSGSEAYKLILKEEVDTLTGKEDAYIFHEHLEEFNEAIYFHEFMTRVNNAGIRYLADANIVNLLSSIIEKSADPFWKDLSLEGYEQYLDFMNATSFRCALLTNKNLRPNYAVNSKSLEAMHVSLRSDPTRTQLATGKVGWEFSSARFITDEIETKTWDRLYQTSPCWISVRELLDGADPSVRGQLLDDLLQAFVRGVVQLAHAPVKIVPLSERPVCSAYIRTQAKRGNRLSSRRHFDAKVNPLQRLLIQNSDGNHGIDSFAELLLEEVKSGRMDIPTEDPPTEDPPTEDPPTEDPPAEDPQATFGLSEAKMAVQTQLKRLSSLGFFIA